MFAVASLGAIALLPASASAHFVLEAPAAAFSQNALGDPQKVGPCGDDGSATPTGEVITVQAGEMLTITINETVFHPGHYRIAIAEDASQLPEPPPVTPGGGDDCASVPIDPAPVLPLLADGVFAHDASFNGVSQTIDIPIPADFTCTNCTLQVLEYMREHGAPCFYHHCATVNVEGGSSSGSTTSTEDDSGSGTSDGESGSTSSPMGTTGSTNGNTSAATSPEETTGGGGEESGTSAASTPVDDPAMDDEGCGCSQSSGGHGLGLLLGLFGLVGLRSRRRPVAR